MDDATALDYCLASLKQSDPERYFVCLFSPAEARGALAALYAFNLDVVSTRDLVSEPMIGEIRFQWWRDALKEAGEGEVSAHPIAGPLLQAINHYRLPVSALLNLLDARVFDLYDDPMPTLADLEAYCGETSSALFRLSSLILSKGGDAGSADLSGHAGVAIGITALLRAFPWHSARGQSYIPQEILERHQLGIDEIRTRVESVRIAAVLDDMRGIARHHLAQSKKWLSQTPGLLKPAFLPLANIEPTLRSMEGKNYHPFETVIESSPLSLIYRYWRMSRSKTI